LTNLLIVGGAAQHGVLSYQQPAA